MADKSRAELVADLERECSEREKRRSELCVALAAIDARTKRIDVLLLRLAKADR